MYYVSMDFSQENDSFFLDLPITARSPLGHQRHYTKGRVLRCLAMSDVNASVICPDGWSSQGCFTYPVVNRNDYTFNAIDTINASWVTLGTNVTPVSIVLSLRFGDSWQTGQWNSEVRC